MFARLQPFGNVAYRLEFTGWADAQGGRPMDNTTLLIIFILVLLLFGGGWYGRGRWY